MEVDTVRSEPFSASKNREEFREFPRSWLAVFTSNSIIDADSDNSDPLVFSLNRKLTGKSLAAICEIRRCDRA